MNDPRPMNYANNPYGAQSIMTASPCELVAKLYAAAITNLRKAITAIEEGDVEARWRANRKAFDIIEHLTLTLNEEEGGEIAENLSQLYTYAMRRLMDVDLKTDPVPAREVIELLEPLYRSWRELAQQTIKPTTGNAYAQAQQSAPATSEAPAERERIFATA